MSIGQRLAQIKAQVAAHPENQEARQLLEQLLALLEANPLQGFEPHSDAQREFFEASTPVVAAFAGNRFGKSTSLVGASLREVCNEQALPEWLRPSKRFTPPVHGWVLAPTEEKIYDSLLPTFRKWAPTYEFKGGNFDKAWNGNRMILSFKNGSTIGFKTYKQHESTLGGTALHFVGYDEPPPRAHREECLTRLIDYGGFEMFAMTPLQTNTGWIRRDIYRQREAPHITVIRGSMHDNPTLDQATKTLTLASYQSDLWRRAREFGDFVDVGGLIYQDFPKAVLAKIPDAEDVRQLDIVVGIDPGMRNAAFVFGGFDNDNVLLIFDVLLLQDKTPDDYAKGIDSKLARWGLGRGRASFVIDPSYRARSMVNAESVSDALSRLGIYCIPGQSNVETGVQQIRSRIQHQRLWISPEGGLPPDGGCAGLIDEADDYAAEDRDDGEFKPIKQNDHRLDALRYLAMHRPYHHLAEIQAANQQLGWQPDTALPASHMQPEPEPVPLGFMS